MMLLTQIWSVWLVVKQSAFSHPWIIRGSLLYLSTSIDTSVVAEEGYLVVG